MSGDGLRPDLPGSVCPAPIHDRKRIVLGHGSGGKLTSELVQNIFLSVFHNDVLDRLDDQAVFEIGSVRLAFTTDSFVVTPLFFPGGDIGKLAIHGTVNDLAMSGARPLYISAAFILEEGLELEELQRVVSSMRAASDGAGVQLVTGDTKVVERGKGDKLFLTTTGIGVIERPLQISADQARPGDKIILSGTIGDHGMAIMSTREGLEFEGEIRSDTAPLNGLVNAMLKASSEVHVMRDPTRGGLATTLNEIASRSKIGITVEQQRIPVHEAVQGACETLGIDPLYVANEGKLVAFVAAADAERVLDSMRNHVLGVEARIIGEAVAEHPGKALMKTDIGGTRILDTMFGEQLPRIC